MILRFKLEFCTCFTTQENTKNFLVQKHSEWTGQPVVKIWSLVNTETKFPEVWLPIIALQKSTSLRGIGLFRAIIPRSMLNNLPGIDLTLIRKGFPHLAGVSRSPIKFVVNLRCMAVQDKRNIITIHLKKVITEAICWWVICCFMWTSQVLKPGVL